MAKMWLHRLVAFFSCKNATLARYEWYLFPLSQPKKNIVSVAELDRTPSGKASGSTHDKNQYIDNPTGSDLGLHYVEYVHVSRACPSV